MHKALHWALYHVWFQNKVESYDSWHTLVITFTVEMMIKLHTSYLSDSHLSCSLQWVAKYHDGAFWHGTLNSHAQLFYIFNLSIITRTAHVKKIFWDAHFFNCLCSSQFYEFFIFNLPVLYRQFMNLSVGSYSERSLWEDLILLNPFRSNLHYY